MLLLSEEDIQKIPALAFFWLHASVTAAVQIKGCHPQLLVASFSESLAKLLS